MRHRELILVAYSCTVLFYFAALVVPPRVGQILSTVGSLLGLPGTLFVLSALRYDALCLLLPTYDVIFFDSIVVATLVVLMIMVHDARILIVVQALIAYQINIVVDANIQAVRRVTIVNLFAMLMSAFVGVSAALDVIPDLNHFTLLVFGSHKLEARAFVTDGFITILAIMIRNTYRKRAVLLNRSNGAVIDCVSYRCHLAIRLVPQSRTTGPPTQSTDGASRCGPTAPHIQTMRHVTRLPLIDAQRVLVEQTLVWLMQPGGGKRFALQVLALAAASLTIGVGVYEFTAFKLHQRSSQLPIEIDHHERHVRLVVRLATALTLTYVATCAALYQRELLRAILTSFDFIFLSTQLTFVHLATADFFHWNANCVLLLATWLWCHWVFCVDALTPAVRDRIGLISGFTKIVMAALVMSTGILNHLLLFSEGFVTIHDRVLWRGSVLGRDLEFRLLPTFYSTYVTVMAWALRLLWRVLVAKRDELVLLDGAVAFDNYLRQPTKSLKTRLLMLRTSAATIADVGALNQTEPTTSGPRTSPSK